MRWWRNLKPFNRFTSKSVYFSYDTRGSHAGTPSHWKDEEILENRAIFRTVRSPAELVIKPVKVRKPHRWTYSEHNQKENFCSRSRNFIDFPLFFFPLIFLYLDIFFMSQEKDAGNFRCRVDFKLSPTRNSNVNLQVVGKSLNLSRVRDFYNCLLNDLRTFSLFPVPPAVPVIYNEQNDPIESRAGPYEESGQLILTCVVIGGKMILGTWR